MHDLEEIRATARRLTGAVLHLNLATPDGRTQPVEVPAGIAGVAIDIQAPTGLTWAAELELTVGLSELDPVTNNPVENWRSFPDAAITFSDSSPIALGISTIGAAAIRLKTTTADATAGEVVVVLRWIP